MNEANAAVELRSRYVVITEDIRQRIEADEFGARLPTVKALAEQYDVSTDTIQRAVRLLKQDGVVTAVPKVGIRPTRMRRARSNMLGVVVGRTVGLGAKLVAGVQKKAWAHRQSAAVECYNDDVKRVELLVKRLAEEREVDGLILWHGDIEEGTLEWVRAQRVPFVLCGEPKTRAFANVHTVGNNDSGCATDVMTHLLGRGHQHIGFVCGYAPEDSVFVANRHSRYRHSLEIAGLPVAEPIIIDSAFKTIKRGAVPPDPDIDRLRPFTAVFCDTDWTAAVVMRECLKNGVKVPDDLAVTGYDNNEIALILDLTSVEQNFERMGETAVDILLNDLDGKLDGFQHRQVNSELIIRGSTAVMRR